MAKRLSRIERDIRDHPEKYDYYDIPLEDKVTPAQQAIYDDMRPQWAKMLAGESDAYVAAPDVATTDDGRLDWPGI